MAAAKRYNLTSQQAAEHLGIAENTLRQWRTSGRYRIPYVKIGRIVKYAAADLDRFIASREKTHT